VAAQLEVHPATVARWKKLDEWDLKLIQAVTSPEEPQLDEQDFYETDLRHVRLLNDRIDSYLRKQELLPAEIRELAEAKYHIMNCMEIIHDQTRYPLVDNFDENDRDFA
jgi:hypothetical protein